MALSQTTKKRVVFGAASALVTGALVFVRLKSEPETIVPAITPPAVVAPVAVTATTSTTVLPIDVDAAPALTQLQVGARLEREGKLLEAAQLYMGNLDDPTDGPKFREQARHVLSILVREENQKALELIRELFSQEIKSKLWNDGSRNSIQTDIRSLIRVLQAISTAPSVDTDAIDEITRNLTNLITSLKSKETDFDSVSTMLSKIIVDTIAIFQQSVPITPTDKLADVLGGLTRIPIVKLVVSDLVNPKYRDLILLSSFMDLAVIEYAYTKELVIKYVEALKAGRLSEAYTILLTFADSVREILEIEKLGTSTERKRLVANYVEAIVNEEFDAVLVFSLSSDLGIVPAEYAPLISAVKNATQKLKERTYKEFKLFITNSGLSKLYDEFDMDHIAAMSELPEQEAILGTFKNACLFVRASRNGSKTIPDLKRFDRLFKKLPLLGINLKEESSKAYTVIPEMLTLIARVSSSSHCQTYTAGGRVLSGAIRIPEPPKPAQVLGAQGGMRIPLTNDPAILAEANEAHNTEGPAYLEQYKKEYMRIANTVRRNYPDEINRLGGVTVSVEIKASAEYGFVSGVSVTGKTGVPSHSLQHAVEQAVTGISFTNPPVGGVVHSFSIPADETYQPGAFDRVINTIGSWF